MADFGNGEPLANLEKLLRLAKGTGISDCEFFWSRSESFEIATVGKNLKSKESDLREGYAVRVLEKGKLGFAFFEDVKNAKREIANARKLAKFSPKTDFSFAEKQKYAKVGAFDRKVEALREEDAKTIALGLLSGVEKTAKPTECGLQHGVGESAIANSEGLFASERRTGMSAFAQANYRGSSSQESYSGIEAIDEGEARKLGERAGMYAKEMDGAKTAERAERIVVFEHDALASLLESMLLANLNGDRARRGMTKLCGKEGELVASKSFSLYDDPFAKAAGRGAFDGEGVASRKMPLIEKGIFKNFLFDRKTAALAGVKKQGNCGRGDFAAQPGITSSNLVLAPGKVKKFEDELDDFIIVKEAHGHHTANTITGDFSVAVDVAWEMKKGKKKPVRGNLLSGNIFELLNRIEGIERESKAYSDFVGPRVAFSGMQVVG